MKRTSKLEIEKYSSFDEIQKAVILILKNELHAEKLSAMKFWCKQWINHIEAICLAKIDNDYVASTILLNPVVDINIGVYVKPQFRRQGIGAKLIASIKIVKPKIHLRPCVSTQIRKNFYTSVGLVADTV